MWRIDKIINNTTLKRVKLSYKDLLQAVGVQVVIGLILQSFEQGFGGYIINFKATEVLNQV